MKKAIISLFLVIVAVIFTAGCQSSSPAGFEPTAKDKKVVMKINGENVQYQEFRYYFLNNKRDICGDDSNLSDADIYEIVSSTEENAKHHAALLIMADRCDAELTSEQRKSIDVYVDSYRTGNFADDETYRLALEAQYLTDYLFRELACETMLAENVISRMKETGEIPTDDASIDAALNDDGLICIKEIYISADTDQTREYSQKKAEEVLCKLVGGEEFEALMLEYSDYSAASLPPEHGYYTTEYDALEEIWETAIGLAEGEYSRIVETPYGFHIVMRCEKDEEYMAENREELFEICAEGMFWEEFYRLMDTLTVEYTSYGKSLDLATIN